ncbi:Ubiquitin carboxyl-terminal hydrolase 25 [Acipenser ruthenus]|uniref:Ubiquitin carboxyl-terminal hydrolase 25 n=1 Tax=Acipenser ruthenus TaxID=7906 RepID=A0A444V204_ACIRT|nr:Ubiquitin carboxyl-terminal hydrolase 25 [Acipenser ruthenus]
MEVARAKLELIKPEEVNMEEYEVMLTPAMQGILMAIDRTRSVCDRCGPEAAFFKAFTMEYARLLRFAQEDTPPETDHRLQHVIVYLIQNHAPKSILERTLLEQFAHRSLGFDQRCKSIMEVARAKLELIKPEEVNMEEYEIWHQDYRNFQETTFYLLTGLELFQKRSYAETLMYLIYAHQYNKELLLKGSYRGHSEELIAHYRRQCLLVRDSHYRRQCLLVRDSHYRRQCLLVRDSHYRRQCLLVRDSHYRRQCLLVRDSHYRRQCLLVRDSHYRRQLQEKLTDFLPKLLDCSTEIRSFRDPPKLPSYCTLELCERFSRVVCSLSRSPADGR